MLGLEDGYRVQGAMGRTRKWCQCPGKKPHRVHPPARERMISHREDLKLNGARRLRVWFLLLLSLIQG